MKNSSEIFSSKKTIKVFGIGGAGCNVLSRIAESGAPEICTVALNTDAASLDQTIAAEKLCLGLGLTHGMGAGGDPELGRSAVEGDVERLKEMCVGVDIVFILAGLGGGTGTAASQILAKAAKDSGALVLGIVTMPFEFEGGRRHRQAQFGLQQLRASADAVISLPNEKVFRLVGDKTTVMDAFKVVNEFLVQSVFGIARLLTQTGLINVDFSDLRAVTSQLDVESTFAAAEGTGENRAQEVVEKLFAHPMLDHGEVLANSESLLVSLVGGPDLTMAEVNRVMKEIKGRCENARITFGATIDEAFAERLQIALVVSGKAQTSAKVFVTAKSRGTSPNPFCEPDTQFMDSSETSRPASRIFAPVPEMTDEKKESLFSKQAGSRPRKVGSRLRQKELQLEIISKGRFEKSEPTIHQGEDLDLPTYLRRGIALN